MHLNLRLSFHNEVEPCKWTSHVLPVPVAVVFGISHIESIDVEFVNRIVHGAKLQINVDILQWNVAFLQYNLYLICYF